jgi:uncharacterized protein (DUF58 family)
MDSSKLSRFRFDTRRRLAARAQRWAKARQGDDNLPLTLLQRRIYILPTKAGIGAAVLLFAMLLAGMNYENSLALFLCFTLSGVALVSMHECHRTLAGLKLLRAHAHSTFAGQHGELQLYFENVDTRLRDALIVKCSPCDEMSFRVKPGELRPVTVNFLASKRGLQRIDRLRLSTTAPMGLFRAWAWLHLPLEVIIYPAPAGSKTLPPQRGQPRMDSRHTRNSGEEEWAWLRNFQDSDSPRSVAWKAYARGAPLMVAHYDSPAGTQRALRFSTAPGHSVEQKLSQLTQWVLECERLGERYALELPEVSLDAGHGVSHRRACLEQLAQYRP